MPYSGPYINYFNSGHLWDEGTLWNGRPNGKIIIYYKNGIIKSASVFNYGELDGEVQEFYKNGVLKTKKWFKNGVGNDLQEGFFLNGSVEYEIRQRKATSYDTVVSYYSTGKLKHLHLIRNGFLVKRKYEEVMDLFNRHFNRYSIAPDLRQANLDFYKMWNLDINKIKTRDLKQANLVFYKMWKLDSTQIETKLAEALLMAREYRFDEAIARLDRILTIEPLMHLALRARGFTIIQKNKLAGVNMNSKNFRETPLTLKDFLTLNTDMQQKVCSDLLLADDLENKDIYSNNDVIYQILNFCRKKLETTDSNNN